MKYTVRYLYNHNTIQFQTNEIILKLAEKSGLGLKYNPVWLATPDDGTVWFVENYLEGSSWKAINNNGHVLAGRQIIADLIDYQELSEAFSHFSLQDSDEEWAALDIQGVGSTLIDPCMASVKQGMFDKANLGLPAIARFKRQHSCNKYCEQLSLTTLKK